MYLCSISVVVNSAPPVDGRSRLEPHASCRRFLVDAYRGKRGKPLLCGAPPLSQLFTGNHRSEMSLTLCATGPSTKVNLHTKQGCHQRRAPCVLGRKLRTHRRGPSALSLQRSATLCSAAEVRALCTELPFALTTCLRRCVRRRDTQ